MTPSDQQFFVDQLIEPVQILEIRQDATSHAYHQFEALSAHVQRTQNFPYTCRLISLCQRNSWQPLQVTKAMLDLIVTEHNFGTPFWQLASCFYRRNLDLEEAYCIPYTELRSGPFIEISYSLRYPEYKPNEGKWTTRQSGIYHRYNTTTAQSTFVLFSPTPRSKAHSAAEKWAHELRDAVKSEPFWLHRVLFATYFPAWREYNAALERRFLPVANNTFATFIDEPLRLGYENLSNLTNLETHFLKISTILAYATDVLDELCVLVRSISQTQGRQRASTEYFRNERAQCIACSRNATHLQQRVQTTARLLADTLLLRDQVVAKEQNKNIFQLNKSAVFITTLTLLYLPSSFMATFFGMNFFAMDQQNSRIVGTSMVWIFVVCSTILTAATFLFYYWLLHRDGTVFRRLVPKVNIAPEWNLQALKRQLTDRIRTGAEMQELQA